MDEFHLPQKPLRQFDAVVSRNAGDFNSLSAALRVAKPGWNIAVASGTFNDAGIRNFAVPKVTVIGVGAESSIINVGNNLFSTAAGATYFKMQGIGITGDPNSTFDTMVNLNGANTEVINCHINHTGTSGPVFSLNGADSLMQSCFINSALTNTSSQTCQFTGANSKITGNEFVYASSYSNAVLGTISFTGTYTSITGNTFKHNATGAQYDVQVGGSYNTFTGNTVFHSGAGVAAVAVIGGTSTVASGNTINGGSGTQCIVINGGSTHTVITGNACVTTGSFGIAINNTGGASTYNTITGNTITGSTGTGGIRSAGAAINTTIQGNTIKPASNGGGIYIADGTLHDINSNTINLPGTGTGINLVQSSLYTVTGNIIKGITTSTAIAINADYTTVVGNMFDTTITTPFNITSSLKGLILKDNLGCTPIQNRMCLYCKNTSGSTINQGAVVVRKAVAAGNEITVTTTASDSKVLGVADEAISNNAWGYVCVEGLTVYLKVNGTADIAVGDFITTYTTAGIGQKATVGTLGTTPGDLAFAIALEAYTTDDSSGVIDALIIEPRRL